MEKVTIKTYAVSHKLSIFNVMKMIKSSKLKSETIKENGKETIYVLLDDKTETEVKNSIVPMEEQEELTVKEIVKILQKEMIMLREEIEVLKKRI